ncbi:ornithine decarboxylase [Prauserella sp. PE36]|uniref:ornithine decarboxylase n=1 Tax=Prauserella endophytica TaxID=1592324 RepID=A0ABY2S414_9PSEU|nr:MULTISPECIES: type III PLP-dependent enzyme [Prauserella]PXY33038.1 ornithine decarboxylase [Prauserella coralliicola]RBM16407.1 ornithine decarboxylase [Prauserella sp. PE36]TKG69548.1 type III PLP-dependent enzyme [Prauserella endophytica]
MSTTLDRIRGFLAEHDPPTPCLVIDVDTVLERYRTLAATFEGSRVQYAVKANPEPAVLRALVAAGASFDVASPAEIELCLAAGAAPETLSYGNTVKKPADIAFAHRAGVREYVVEAESDLVNVAERAPGAEVSVRLLVEAPASVTPFGRKFGCAADQAVPLLLRAAELGLDPAGVSFHVGSQQLDTGAWDLAIASAAKVFTATAEHGVPLRRLNVGGGISVAYTGPAPAPADYAAAIGAALREHLPGQEPEVVLEPGRAIVAEAGLIRCEVVLVSRKSADDPERWVYLDVGRYNGLAETENEAIAYRLEVVTDHSTADGPVIIAGPTCDGDDVLYQRTPYRLPLSLRPGDRIDILSAGAYTASYSSVAFNGIPPLRTYCIHSIHEGRPPSAE